MRPGADLVNWLADPVAQAATAARNRRFAEEVRATGRLADVSAELDDLVADDRRADRAAAILAALRRLLGDDGWARTLVDSALASAAADPFFEPPFAAASAGSRAGLVLLDHPLAIVTLSVMTPASVAEAGHAPGRRSIGFTGTRSLIRFAKSGGARIAFYASAECGDDFRSAAAPPCIRLRRRAVVDGEIVAIDGRHESFVIEAMSAPLVAIAGELRADPAALAREYDAATLAFAGASAADEACSRIQLMLSLLRALGRADAGTLFAKTIAGAPFFLRWQAMQDYLALDAAAALPLLIAMAAGDPHEEVRAAAQRTLAILRVRHPALFAGCRRGIAA